MHRLTMRRAASALALLAFAACGGGSSGSGGAPSVQVGSVFPAGTVLREHYSGRTLTVAADGTLPVDGGAEGIMLLERDGAGPTPFRWDAATVYFAITDRFENGDPSNDGSYGRTGDGGAEIGTWHGGDLAGLTARLDHLASLGVDAVWISPFVEQVHGWVGGGNGAFQHYAYAGYWALDFTRLDANFGTEDDLRAFVDAAHARGIRVVVDVVLNHAGYATGADLLERLPSAFLDRTGDAFRAFTPAPPRRWDAWNDLVDYSGTTAWNGWWGPEWIRAGFREHDLCGQGAEPPCSDLSSQQAFLPDFKTESTAAVAIPPLLAAKTDTQAVTVPGFTVSDYLVAWHADWVRRFGIDGFRCDTAKHVERAVWKRLEEAASAALEAWRAENPGKSPGTEPFWMLGEVFPHGVSKDAYFTEGGFDALLNFDFQPFVAARVSRSAALVDSAAELEGLYADMAGKLVADPDFDVTSYLSSHDTSLFFARVQNDAAKQRAAGTALLLVPGSAQVFYGDESGRRFGASGADTLQGTRSDMNWSSMDESILAHFRKLGTFRRKHAAIGAGTHARLDSPAGTYAFSRSLTGGGADDRVVVVLTRPR